MNDESIYLALREYAMEDKESDSFDVVYGCYAAKITKTTDNTLTLYFYDNPTGASVPQPTPLTLREGKEVYPIVMNDILERAQTGKEKYGTTLHTNNGRKALWDLYQELLDAVVYLRQELMECEGK